MSREEETVRQAATDFVDAFNDLDWDRFEASFAEDATVFFPTPEQPHRVQGRDAIIGAFKSIFESVPEREPGPPYLSIQPVDVHVRMLDESAIVTFHLAGTDQPNRRTLIFARRQGRWLIVHLHASRIAD